MKKTFLTIFLLLISLSVLASEKKVHITRTTSSAPKPQPRSGVIAPTVYVDAEICQLSISMVSNDSFTVYVYDGRGGVVYQGSVVSDGGRQVYLLPELDADLYTISIEGSSAAYEGEFYVN